ncbi:MAG: hypothetical protein WA021_02145, partial [Minisyncoccia bacterium]
PQLPTRRRLSQFAFSRLLACFWEGWGYADEMKKWCIWIWALIGTESNHRSISSTVQILGLAAAIFFGLWGVGAITDINVNLKELKAESIEAERANLGDVNVTGNCDMKNDPNCRASVRFGTPR